MRSGGASLLSALRSVGGPPMASRVSSETKTQEFHSRQSGPHREGAALAWNSGIGGGTVPHRHSSVGDAPRGPSPEHGLFEGED